MGRYAQKILLEIYTLNFYNLSYHSLLFYPVVWHFTRPNIINHSCFFVEIARTEFCVYCIFGVWHLRFSHEQEMLDKRVSLFKTLFITGLVVWVAYAILSHYNTKIYIFMGLKRIAKYLMKLNSSSYQVVRWYCKKLSPNVVLLSKKNVILHYFGGFSSVIILHM